MELYCSYSHNNIMRLSIQSRKVIVRWKRAGMSYNQIRKKLDEEEFNVTISKNKLFAFYKRFQTTGILGVKLAPPRSHKLKK